MVRQNGARSCEDTCHKKLIARRNFQHDQDQSTAQCQAMKAQSNLAVVPSTMPLDGPLGSAGLPLPRGRGTAKAEPEPGWGMFVNRATFTEMHLA